jgi:trimeric autotransporter adhesin
MKNNFFKKWLTLSALFAFMCISPYALLKAQSTANYAFSTNTTGSLGLDMNGNVADMSTGTTQLVAADLDNGSSVVTNIGFTFTLYGSDFTQFSASSNGLVQLGGTAVSSSAYVASGGSINSPRIGALVADLRTGSAGKVHYKVVGTAPNRCLVVEFLNMSITYVTSPGSNDGTYQVRLYESTGVIEYVYGSMFRNSSSTSNAAINTGFSVNTTANTLASVTTSSNTVSYATYNLNTYATATNIANLHSTVEGSRRVYQFTPPVPLAPSSLSFSSIGTSYMNLNWTDNATNEIGYAIYRSLDGVTYTYVTTLPANSVSYSALGLSPSTLYYWNVNAISEGASSTPLSGSQLTSSCSTISGVKTVGAGGDYPNLSIAFSDINSCTLSGNTELQLIAGYPAIAEAYPIQSSNTAAVGAFNVKVYPTVSGLSITSNNTTGTLNLNNAKNLTLDGRVNQTGANDLIIANTNVGTSYAILLNNDANDNVIQNCIIQSTNTSTTSGTIVFGTTTGTNGNDNNTISACDIRDGASTPVNGIYSLGTTTTTAQFNDNNIISGNNISNFFSAGSATAGVFVGNGNSTWTISNNKLFQTVTRTYTSGNTHNGIQVSNTSGNGFIISSNTIGFASSTGTGTYTIAGTIANRFIGINISVGTTAVSSVQGNTISGINLSSSSGAATANGIFAGINITNGNVNVGTTTPNIIGAATGTGAIVATTSTAGGLVVGINSSSAGTVNINGNTIGSINGLGSTATAPASVTGIQVSAGTPTINGNTIGSTATANSINALTVATGSTSQLVRGIDVTSGVTLATSVQSNTVSNLTQSGTTTSGSIRGINYAGSGLATISLNTVYNLSGANGSSIGVIGILNGGSATTGAIINKNTVYNLASTNTGAIQTGVIGIGYAGPTAGSITANTIYDIRNASTMAVATTPPTAVGILVQGVTTSVNISNNMVSLGDAQTTNTQFIGVLNNITSVGTLNIYHNSISISGTAASGALPSFGFQRGNNSTTAITSPIDFRNNMISNTRSGGTGKHYAIANQSGTASTTGWGLNASNYNVLNANAATVGLWGSTDQAFNAWRTASSGDANSYSGIPVTFVSVPTANLHLNMGSTATPIESGGANIAAVTTDFDAQSRPGPTGSVNGGATAPDLGADEFDGVPAIPVITLNSVTPPATTQCVAAARLISVNVIPSTGTTVSVTIGYTVNGVAQTPISMTNPSGTTWQGTIPVPTPANANISWAITTVNSMGINGNYTGTAYSDEPLLGVTATASVSSMITCAGSPTVLTTLLSKAGNVTIGAGASVTTNSGASGGTYISPFSHYFGGYKSQYVIRASELTAAGLSAGNFNSLAFDVTTAGTTYNGFTLSIAPTAATVANATFLTGTFTDVYSGNLNIASTGLNTITFSTPFNWDGTSNIIVNLCWSNNNGGGTAAEVKYDATSFVSQAYYRVDSQTATFVCGTTGATGTQSNRPKMIINGNASLAIQSISWSDGVTAVGTTNPLTVNPTATTTYTATITAIGCTVSPSPTTTVTVIPLPTAPTATNSAQCGVQVPTASVTSTSGLPTPTFKWYAASSGGTALQTSTSTTYTSTVATTTTFYVSELNTTTGCESTRTPVTVNVSTPDQVSLTASAPAICIGGSVTLTAANLNPTPFQSYTYSTVSTTGSGAETPMAGASISVTPTAAGTYTYTLTATDGGCAASATTTVLVNSLPTITTATATPATVCSNDPITLVGQSILTVAGGQVVIGAGALTSNDTYSSPFRHLFGGMKGQYIIRASELTAAGLSAGNITALGLNITTVGTTYAGFTVHIGNTGNTDLSGGLVPVAGLTQVYSNATLTLTPSSLNTFTFATPFPWDGVSNIVVQTSWSNNNGGGTNSEVQYDNTSYVSNAYFRADNSTPATILAGATASGTLSSRPKMTFTGVAPSNVASTLNWVWTPGTGLNTAVATTSITNTSGSAMNQAFTVTVTNPTTGCVATTATPAVTINSAAAAPVANNSTQCGTMTPTASVTGSGTPGNTFSWYLLSTGGTAIAGQTASSLSGYPVSATTTFYVSESNGTCSSGRTPVTVTVTTPPAITIAGTTTICNGSSTSLTVSSPNDPNYTYTWSGGLGTGAAVTASPTVNTSYTVTATDASGGANNGCVTTSTASITVNPLPSTGPIVPATATICAGSVQQLTSETNTTAIFGTGVTAPSNTSFPNPLSAYYGGVKHQMLFTAAELSAQGLIAGSKINAVTFDLNTFVGNACTNFTIRMGNTASTALTGFVGGTSTVYGPTTFTPSAAGLVTFTFTIPYTWDGTSNIVVETVHNAGNGGNGSGTRTNTTTTTANTVFYGAKDNVAGSIAGFDALTTWTNTGASNLRPNIRFTYSVYPVWSPTSSLYTDAGATTSYSGASLNGVYAKPLTTTTYVATYTGSNGCTAQSTATITVKQPTSSTIPVTACSSYTLNGTTYATSGTYTQTLTNAAGCDSVITLNLTINNATASSVSVVACETYTWAQNGMTYIVSGAYNDTVPNAVGCDSVITLNLTINQPTAATVNQLACQTYTWPQNGMTYVVSGMYNDTIMNAAGCDSVVTLNLTIGGPSASLFPQTACGSYTWPQTGMTYFVSGAYNDTIPNMFGCDSVITLSLTINQPSVATVLVTECTSYTWAQNGMTYTTSGLYNDTIPNAAGCDSVVTLNLTIIQPTTSSVTVVACDAYTWTQNGTTYTTSGSYNDTIPNAVGCDSIITLNVTINNSTASTVTISTCNPTYTWAQNGTVYTASGMYTDTVPNAAGCDSVITLNLTIGSFVATATDNGNATITASSGTSYQWINCTTNTAIAGATAQTFAATVNGSYAVIVSNGTCTDTSNCVSIANVGIKENTISTISVHPNPTHDVVIVTMDASSATVEVMDVQGKLIQTTQIKSGDQVDLSGYERGVYTLRIKTEFGTSLERIVKN